MAGQARPVESGQAQEEPKSKGTQSPPENIVNQLGAIYGPSATSVKGTAPPDKEQTGSTIDPPVFTATDKLNVGLDNKETALQALLEGGRDSLIGKYSAYAYTDALYREIEHTDNPIQSLHNINKKGFYNYRNLLELSIAGFRHVKEIATEQEKNKMAKTWPPGQPLVPVDHGMFHGDPKELAQAKIDWDDPNKQRIVRLIHDVTLDAGPIKFQQMYDKLKENPRTNIKLVPIKTREDLIAALDESQSHVGKGTVVVNVLGFHGDVRESDQTTADLYVGGFDEKNKVDTGKLSEKMKGTITGCIACYGDLIFKRKQTKTGPNPISKPAAAAPDSSKPSSTANK